MGSLHTKGFINMSIKPWIVLKSKKIFQNEWLSLRADTCRIQETGVELSEFYVIERKDSVYIVPVTSKNQVILVRQYRHASGQVLLEVPAGYINSGEMPQQAAERELFEETGYSSKRIEPLAVLYTSPAILTNKAYLFLCRDLEKHVRLSPDDTENIELVTFDFDDLVRVGIDDNVLLDANSVSAIMLAYRRLRLSND